MATIRPWALLINIVIPGMGLIIRRREWLGFSLSILFGVCGNLFLAGWLIAPAAIPFWLTGLAGALAVLTWVISQVLLAWQAIYLRRSACELDDLLALCRAALERNDRDAARTALERAGAYDQESVELHVLWARLWVMEGDPTAACKCWLRVLELDSAREYQVEAHEALKGHGAA